MTAFFIPQGAQAARLSYKPQVQRARPLLTKNATTALRLSWARSPVSLRAKKQ